MFSYEWQTCPIRNLGSKNPNPRLVSSNPRLMTSNLRLVKCNPSPRRQSPEAETPPRKLRLRPPERSEPRAQREMGRSLNFRGGVSAEGGTADAGEGWISPAEGWKSSAEGWKSPAEGYDFLNRGF